ncbi:MAG: hypothetical protein ACREMY_21355, partial [bacterium]
PEIAAVVTIITNAVGEAISRIATWVREHSGLLKEIASIGAVVGAAVAAYGLIGAAIAAITSPVGLTIAAIVALALLWEKAREFGEIEVGGRPISAYIRAAWDFVGGVTALFVQNLLTQFEVLWHGAKAIFGSLVEVVIAPMRLVATLVSKLPDSVAASVPGGEAIKATASAIKGLLDTTAAAFSPLDNLKQVGTDLSEGWQVSGALFDQTVDKMEASLKSKDKLPSIADGIFGGVAAAFRKRIDEMLKVAGRAAKAAPNTRGDGGGGQPPIPAAVQKAFDDYLRFISEVREKGNAAGDPLSETLANLLKQRNEAWAKIKEASQNPKFAQLHHDFAADVLAVSQSFEKQATAATTKAAEAELKVLAETTRSIQAQIESDRIALI